MTTSSALTCPKCQGQMRSYERSGIVVDQCADCRGLFLDRGELERLMDLETRAVEPNAPNPQWQAPAPDRAWRQNQPEERAWSRNDWDDDSDSHRRHGRGGAPHKPRKKHSMLREFLDFG